MQEKERVNGRRLVQVQIVVKEFLQDRLPARPAVTVKQVILNFSSLELLTFLIEAVYRARVLAPRSLCFQTSLLLS